MNYQTFKTKKSALEYTETMRGWVTKAVKLYLPDSQHADKNGYAWVIQCDSTLYLRPNGYVS